MHKYAISKKQKRLKIEDNGDKSVKQLNIKEPFYTAGKKLNWDIDKWGCVGIGINERVLNSTNYLEITVGDSKVKYILETVNAIEYARQNNSYYVARRTKLCVIPLRNEFFDNVIQPKIENGIVVANAEKKEEEIDYQTKLF